jgi:hypothetical protein
MENESGYNGWTNYETWCLQLWLTNEEGSYRYWREEARRHRDEAPKCEQVKEGIWTREQAAKFNLADQLKDEIEDASPLTEATVFSDLLNAALSEVSWNEVAAAFLEELDPSEDGRPDEENDDEPEDGSDWEKPAVSDELKFSLGQVVGTPGAVEAVTGEERSAALTRHHRGDWGDVCRDDWQANDEALTEGSRLFSVYHAKDGTKFWIITEADRSSTCVLLPSDY